MTNTREATVMDDVLTLEEAAHILKVSTETVRRKAAAGIMPGAKVGREWRFSRRQLMAWLEEGGMKARPQRRLAV